MSQPLAIDLFCGLGGWTESLLAEGYYSSSKSSARKMASAMIAKIPLPLGRHIARTFYPQERAA